MVTFNFFINSKLLRYLFKPSHHCNYILQIRYCQKLLNETLKWEIKETHLRKEKNEGVFIKHQKVKNFRKLFIIYVRTSMQTKMCRFGLVCLGSNSKTTVLGINISTKLNEQMKEKYLPNQCLCFYVKYQALIY